MVSGADDMLDYLAKGGKCVVVQMSEEPFAGAMALELTSIAAPGGGAYYKPHDHTIQSVWLCDVTLFAIGSFPEMIYFKAIS